MGKKIKVHYYSVGNNHPNISLDGLLNQIRVLQIGQRTRTIGHGDINLELVEKHGPDWFMHFTAARVSNWPGVGQRGQASSDLNLAIGTELMENTYAAFDTNTGVMVLQYTQSAVRATRLFSYLDEHAGQPNTFFYAPMLNGNALNRYAQKHAFTEVEAVIDNVSPADIAFFQGSPVASAVRESVQAGVTKLTVSFSVNARVQSNKIQSSLVNRMVNTLIARQSQSDKLVVKGRDAQGTPLESIDLLADVKTEEYDERLITLTPGRRYRPVDMRRILFDALRK